MRHDLELSAALSSKGMTCLDLDADLAAAGVDLDVCDGDVMDVVDAIRYGGRDGDAMEAMADEFLAAHGGDGDGRYC